MIGFFLSRILSLSIIGIILIVVNVLQYIAPAQNLAKVIREKNHKLIPIYSTIIGSLCSGGWTLFGFIIADMTCIIPSALGCLSSIITTLVWCWVYFLYGKKEEEEEKKEDDKNFIEKGDEEEN